MSLVVLTTTGVLIVVTLSDLEFSSDELTISAEIDELYSYHSASMNFITTVF